MKLSADGTVAGTFKVGDGPLSAAYAGGLVYVVNNGGNSVSMLRAGDGASAGTFAVERSPVGLAVTGSVVWVTNSGSGSVSKR
jgi:DNA-binding beta-propeller fold protein YncE